MAAPGEPIRIDRRDLYSPQVEDYLEIQQNLRRELGEIEPRPLLVRIFFSSWFYLAIASGLGALAAWALMEPHFDDFDMDMDDNALVKFLFFPTVTGFVGLFLGAAEGLMCRNLPRAALCGAVGFGVGFGAGIVAVIPVGILFVLMTQIAWQWSRDPAGWENLQPTGLGFLVLMMGRGMAWAVASIPAGLGQGIALREKKVLLNGVVGAVLGGLLGGILFDPIYALLTTDALEAKLSRAVGFTLIGVLVGLFVGLVEGWTKTAWLLMQKGPLAGKQFVIYRDTTVLGSSPRADIYLFKDDAIEPRHALIHNRGGRFEIEDLDTPDGTYVNGIPIHRQMLSPGDQIVLGKTVLEFSIRERA